MTDITETAEHNPIDGIRMFRNEARHPQTMSLLPDGIVRVVDVSDQLPPRYLVEYVEAPEGFAGRRFYVEGNELTRPTQPVIDIDAWWVVVIPGVPTFYLNGTVQGITGKLHAAKIAAQIHPLHSVGPSNIERMKDILS